MRGRVRQPLPIFLSRRRLRNGQRRRRPEAAHQRRQLCPLQNLRHRRPLPNYRLGRSRRRRWPQLRRHVARRRLPDLALLTVFTKPPSLYDSYRVSETVSRPRRSGLVSSAEKDRLIKTARDATMERFRLPQLALRQRGTMKQIQSYMSLLMSFLLLVATSESLGCGSQQAAAPVAQQQAANGSPQDPAAQQPPADPNAPAQDASQDQSQTQLPAVDLTADGLDELLAPVALYPDPVLAILLQASVDPQQVMDGGNWLALDANQNLTGDALDIASAKAGVTPVMQALLHYPTVIDLMCQEFDWTKQLGAAYQADPKAVLASAQRLRAQAVDTGALKSSPQMTVDIKQDQGKEVVELKPTDPQVVYVPQYNPDQVFSTPPTPTRPAGPPTTTTTSSGPPPAAAPAPAPAAVQQQSSGVSTESA